MAPKPSESPNPTPNPGTPRKAPAVKNGAAPTTPAARRASVQPGATPKSAPAAAGQGSKKKPEPPSLLVDFLLGRPPPTRGAGQRSASKPRRKSVALDAAGVREELRQEMRAAAVRRLQQPGGVRDRVNAWQKANNKAMKAQGGGVPDAEDVATEPTEVAANIDGESVNEEDRVRIKLRQKPKKRKSHPAKLESTGKENTVQEGIKEPGNPEEGEPELGTAQPPKASQPKERPKKRIVSDDNWMKRNKGKGIQKDSSPKPKVEATPTPIPKDFLQRTAQNPSVQNKIKDWTKRVEIPELEPVLETPKSTPRRTPREKPRVKQYHTKSGETVTVEEDASTTTVPEPAPKEKPKVKPAEPFDDGIRVKPIKPKKPPVDTDDGIRIKPMRSKEPPDDGIRVRPTETRSLPDDGIRVRAIDDDLPDDGIRIRPGRRRSRSVDETTILSAPSSRSSSASRTSIHRRRDHSPSQVIEVIEETETEVATPTRRQGSSQRRKPHSRSPRPKPKPRPERVADSDHSEDGRASQVEYSDDESQRPPTVAGNKSLADIPFGYSAFSELDLPLGADPRRSVKKPKAQRNPSFKAVPNVFKKVMSGAKEMIHEAVDPPKPVAANQPPKIEDWLNGTVDPFVETPQKVQSAEMGNRQEPPKRSVSQARQGAAVQEPQKRSLSQARPKDTAQETQKRSISRARRAEPVKPTSQPAVEDQENTNPKQDDSDATPKKSKTPTTPSTGLKRRRATRSTSSPIKFGGKKTFREALKEAFSGESGGHKLPPTVYPSCEADYESVSDPEDDGYEPREARRRSTGSSKRSPSPDPLSTISSSQSSAFTDPYPSRRRPPTKGHHELSTIVSEDSSSFISDTISDVSHTTITQTTAFTKSTELTRQKSHKSSLKRRLTKHSDLVSVLSLPDNGQLVPPSRSRSVKSSRSLHRKPSRLDRGKIDDLLDEFSDDEHFYGRELKTLVDGVVPVLLKEVVRIDSNRRSERGGKREDAMAKSVVNMGIALERLRNLHRSVPLSDIRHLLTWLETVAQVYDDYLDVWRLGFQDLIVNLAPASRFDENDSLVNALPRNEDGDVLGEHGERVDVAYLLRRPLIRVKWMTKFLKAAVLVMETREADDLLVRFEGLQEKARKRHREEVARMTDEDAINTDTTRARDLRNFAPLDGVAIDHTRQVAAKDSFELDLYHSSGQRLECQVELIYRDNPNLPADKGDILVREIGNSTQSWLLFPPIPMERISARRGDTNDVLLIMVRGTHNHQEWFELLRMSTPSDEQIMDWLDILGSNPLPPLTRPQFAPSLVSTPPKPGAADIPLGERRPDKPAFGSPGREKPQTPSRYRTVQRPMTPTSPTSTSAAPYFASPSPSRTPTQESYLQQSPPVRALPETPEGPISPSWENAHHDPAKTTRSPPNSTPYREDGAPPPPIHRTLTTKGTSQLSPPVDLGLARVKRRGSSPLKHEYHPSDASSDSSSITSDESESSQSSSDELDEDEVPDTVPGYSIRKPEPASAESVISESSITPSHSASQVGTRPQNKPNDERPSRKFVASVSYWSSKKGMWKEVIDEACSVVIYPGSLEVHYLDNVHLNPHISPVQSSGLSGVDHRGKDSGRPIVALVLTPVVMIRHSTVLDLEIRSPAAPGSLLRTNSAIFRFRSRTGNEAKVLYDAVHRSRLNNELYIQLAEEARVRSFGQPQNVLADDSADGSGRRLSFFGRKNSYRASTRAPSVSQHSTSTSISANSFLRRLMGGNNNSFNLDESSVDKQSRPGSIAHGGSLESSSGSSAGGATPPRSVSISLSGSGQSQSRWSIGLGKPFSPNQPLEIRLHLNIKNNRWQDKGNCILHISQPAPGVKQELPMDHGLEKRITVTQASKKPGDKPRIWVDAVLGSLSFSMLGSKGVLCSLWEDARDSEGNVGAIPQRGAAGGKLTKWCFQCKSMQQADWIYGIVTSEVPISGLLGGYSTGSGAP